MNDHLVKPVEPGQLYATLLRWLPQPDAAPAAVLAAPARPDPPAPDAVPLVDRLAAVPGLDLDQGLRNVGGELGVLRRVLDRFVQIYADGLGPLDRKLAHSLRGASAAIGAGPLQAALQAYEAAAGEADAATTQELATAVAQELGQLVSRLREALGPAAP